VSGNPMRKAVQCNEERSFSSRHMWLRATLCEEQLNDLLVCCTQHTTYSLYFFS
jgi:hypothetical protein